jgi:thiamine-phosphate pyrophosphorylase
VSAAPPPDLIALTPGDLNPAWADQLLTRAARAVAAGLRGVLVREPALPDRPLLELLRRMAEVLEPVDGWLGVHDRAHLAAGTVAGVVVQGLHLGFRSLLPNEARAVVGPDVALGLSTHEGDEPERWAGCEYRFFGPLLDTPSKRGLVKPAGFEALAQACEHSTPVWAIGGLLPEHGPAVRAAGAAGLVARAGLLGAPDPATATAAYLEGLA